MTKQLKKQQFYTFLGTIFLFAGFIAITYLPLTLQYVFSKTVNSFIFSRVEFLLLFLSGIFYTLSPRYYKFQCINIIFLMLMYGFYFWIF